jgi:hypothetical protein
MIRENRQLVTDEPVAFEVQDRWKITDHFRGIYGIYPNLIKENRRMSTCNRLDLQTLGSQPMIYAQIYPQSLVWIVKPAILSWQSERRDQPGAIN